MSMACETVIFVFRGVLSGLMCVVGLFGNALSIAVLFKIGGTSVTYFLLRALAVVDTVYLVAYIPAVVIPEFFYFYGADMKLLNWYQYLIWGLFPVASMSLTATVWVTTLVTVHRYVAISRPTEKYALCTMRGAMVQISVVLACSVLVDIPKFFERQVTTEQTSNETYIQVITVTDLWRDKTYQLVYKNIAMIGIRKVLPIVITFVLTVLLVRLLVKRRNRRQQLFQGGQNDQGPRQCKRLSHVLISIASVLIVCQTPMAIYPLFRLVFNNIPFSSCNHFYYYFSNIADWLGVVNSAANFFIYYPAVPTFRQQLVTIFSCVSPPDGNAEDRYPLSNGCELDHRRDQPEDTLNTCAVSRVGSVGEKSTLNTCVVSRVGNDGEKDIINTCAVSRV